MASVIIEIRAAEGGDDAKLFVNDMRHAYFALAAAKGWRCDLEQETPAKTGFTCVRLLIEGKGIDKLRNEAGGHRVQRVPPTELRGYTRRQWPWQSWMSPWAPDHAFMTGASHQTSRSNGSADQALGVNIATEEPLFVILR